MNEEIFDVLEQLGITSIVKDNKIYFLDLESESFMKIYEEKKGYIPVDKFKADTFYSIYSPVRDKMVRIYLKNPRVKGVKDESKVILSNVDYFEGAHDYNIDLDQFPTARLKVEYRYKENDVIKDNKEFAIESDGYAFFTETKKNNGDTLIEYAFAGFDKFRDNKAKDIAIIKEAIEDDKMVKLFLNYYGKYHKSLNETVAALNIVEKVLKKNK